MTSADRRREEKRLDLETKPLRSFPPQPIADNPAEVPGRQRKLSLWRLATRRTRVNAPGASTVEVAPTVRPLPRQLNPADVALALGPDLDSYGNALRAMKFMAWWAILPVAYYAWGGLNDDSGLATFRAIGGALSYMLSELSFWLGYGLCFGLVWSLLPGRRGSIRALYATLWYLPVLAIVTAINMFSDHAPPTNALLRGSLLLVALLMCGVVMDLWVLRPTTGEGAQRPQPAVAFVVDYFRLNKLLPIATLLIPLVAAIVGIWTQLDNSPTPAPPSPQSQSNQSGQNGGTSITGAPTSAQGSPGTG